MSKVLMLGKIEGQKQRRVAEDEMLDSITDSMDMNLGKFQETVRDREALVQVSSAAQSCPTPCAPRTAAHQASPSITNSQSLLKLMSIESVMPCNRLILCCPLLLLPGLL